MIDIDADWNPEKCSLDEHRMKKLATLVQPGFGIHATQQDIGPIPEVIDDDETQTEED